MARIDGIRMRLENWARWCARSDGKSLGFASTNMLYRMAPPEPSGSRESVIPTNDIEAAETQRAVDSLRYTRPHLHVCLIWHYARGYEIKRVALHMCKAVSTVKRNLEDADRALEQWLTDQAEERRRPQRPNN